jgi:hypothetical protein
MRLREFRDSDIPVIDAIWRAHHADDFSVPNRKNAIVDAIVENDDGEVIAYGQVKAFAEAMLVLDLNASRRERIVAVKLLMMEAFRGANNAGLEQMYCFIKDPDFATLVEKHFGFSIVDKGEVLLKEEV